MDTPDDIATGETDDQSTDSLAANIELEITEDSGCDDGDQFTLETLSKAYASVVEQQNDTENETTSASAVAENVSDDPKIDDDTACPLSPESIVESILFVGCPSDVKLTGKKIASVLRDVSPREVGQIVKKLNSRYKEQDAAWRISSEKGVYRMVLDESLTDFQDDYFGRNREVKLNQSSIDVLAVVAYHQPATKDEIDKVRGKSSGSVLNQLVKRELLTRERTDEKPARKLYRTTDRFLDLFGLEGIEDLPQSHEVADIEELAD